MSRQVYFLNIWQMKTWHCGDLRWPPIKHLFFIKCCLSHCDFLVFFRPFKSIDSYQRDIRTHFLDNRYFDRFYRHTCFIASQLPYILKVGEENAIITVNNWPFWCMFSVVSESSKTQSIHCSPPPTCIASSFNKSPI